MRGRLFVVSAPSGAGKTSLVETVLPIVRKKHRIEQVTTYTSKQPRSSDAKRKDFYFVTSSEFERLIKKQFFLEWSDAYGAYYGTPRSIMDDLKMGSSFIVVIDRVGAQQICTEVSDAVLIWIAVHDMEVLQERLTKRGTESTEQIAMRLQRAQIEIDLECANRLYTHHIPNDHFATAANNLASIIIQELT